MPPTPTSNSTSLSAPRRANWSKCSGHACRPQQSTGAGVNLVVGLRPEIMAGGGPVKATCPRACSGFTRSGAGDRRLLHARHAARRGAVGRGRRLRDRVRRHCRRAPGCWEESRAWQTRRQVGRIGTTVTSPASRTAPRTPSSPRRPKRRTRAGGGGGRGWQRAASPEVASSGRAVERSAGRRARSR